MHPRTWFPDRLVGRLVVLRRHVPSNLVAFKRWYSDPEIARLTRYQDGPMHPAEIERFFAARVVSPDSLALAVHLRTPGQEAGRLIGSCAFSQLDGDNGSALYHITLGEKDTWGHGYGTEATELMLEHAFEILGLHRIALSVFEFNERAVQSYLKVGFSVEGRARDAIWRDGRYWDEISMSVLDSDWQRRRGRAQRREGGARRTSSEQVPARIDR
ncbi:MAG TPA: GNAT family protein [Candidatus Limnocylindrales bacterium]|jgi:RimJ/RimL family protein N-acetyltransferase